MEGTKVRLGNAAFCRRMAGNGRSFARFRIICLEYKENGSIQKALDGQNPLLWPKAFFSKSSTDVTVEVGFDENALESEIQSIQAVTQDQTEPKMIK